MTTIHADCRHHRVSVPCGPHKRTQVRCDGCREYHRVEGRILIVKLDAMGDVLRTTACLAPLKELHPRSHVTWITRQASRPVLAGNPWIDRILTVESNYLEFVLAEDFDLALGPDADALSAAIMRLARAGVKRGFVSDGRGGVVPLNEAAASWWRLGLDDVLKRENRLTYGEWLYAILELPRPTARPLLHVDAESRDLAGRVLGRCPPGTQRRICFNTGASGRWQEKRWKPQHYRDLALLIREAEPDTAIVLTGGPEETELNAALLRSPGPFVDGGTDNSVGTFAALIASCGLALTPDSLGYHVACAVGTPALCLAGPTAPWELDLYGMNRVLHADSRVHRLLPVPVPFRHHVHGPAHRGVRLAAHAACRHERARRRRGRSPGEAPARRRLSGSTSPSFPFRSLGLPSPARAVRGSIPHATPLAPARSAHGPTSPRALPGSGASRAMVSSHPLPMNRRPREVRLCPRSSTGARCWPAPSLSPSRGRRNSLARPHGLATRGSGAPRTPRVTTRYAPCRSQP